jgi:hypothetical protein
MTTTAQEEEVALAATTATRSSALSTNSPRRSIARTEREQAWRRAPSGTFSHRLPKASNRDGRGFVSALPDPAPGMLDPPEIGRSPTIAHQPRRDRRRVEGQTESLLPIPGEQLAAFELNGGSR